MIIKIILCPAIFITTYIGLFVGLIFPTTFILGFTIISALTAPFVWVLNKAFNNDKDNIEYMEVLVCPTKYMAINHILSLTMMFWIPFLTTYRFIKYNELPFIFND